MFVKDIYLHDFRNLAVQTVALKPRINFFIGQNGQGKTNFLEAVYILSRGTSFRPGDIQYSIKNESMATVGQTTVGPRMKIRGRFDRNGLQYGVDFWVENGKRQALINTKRAHSADLIKNFPVVLFSPESLSAIKEGPEARRALVDELIVMEKPSQVSLMREFSKALRTRNRILSDLAQEGGKVSSSSSELTLESLNQIFLILATHLTTARIEALRTLQPHLNEAMHMISGTGSGDVSVDYVISDQSAMNWGESDVFTALQKRLSELRSAERSSGRSLVGPQKHDVRFLFAGNDSRFYCSQGQQRALILAMKIAQIVYHHQVHQTYPILLLDDVLSELDPAKRENLMEFLEKISAQVLITATDLTWPERMGADANSIFNVARGHVKNADTSP